MALITRRTRSRGIRRPAPAGRVRRARSCRLGPTRGTSARSAEGEEPGAQAVVDVVVVVGDVVGQGRDLGFGPGEAGQLQVAVPADIFDDRLGQPAGAGQGAVDQRPVVLDHALQGLPGQVEAVEGGVFAAPAGSGSGRSARCGRSRRRAPWPRAGRPRRHGRRGCGPGRGPAPAPRPGPRSGPGTRADRAGDLGDLQAEWVSRVRK